MVLKTLVGIAVFMVVILAFVAGALFLNDRSKAAHPDTPGGTVLQYEGRRVMVKKVDVDGTPCVVLVGSLQGSVSCDWR